MDQGRVGRGSIRPLPNSAIAFRPWWHPRANCDTKALLSAIPITDYYEEQKRERIVLGGEVPSPMNKPPGCPFHPRCNYATAQCAETMPELRTISGNHRVACHNV